MLDREAEHETHRLALGRKREQPPSIGRKGLAHDRLDAGCEPAGRIAGRDPDRLGPEVKPDQRAAAGSSAWTSTSGRTGAGMPEA